MKNLNFNQLKSVKTTSVADATNNSENSNVTNSQDSTTATNGNIQPIFDNPFETNEILPTPNRIHIPTVNPSNNVLNTSPNGWDSAGNNTKNPVSAPIGPTKP